MSATAPAVEVDGLVMRYGDTTAVDGLSMTVDRGTITAVLGPNGAGKTTTLETCEGYRAPHHGTVRVLGLDPLEIGFAFLPCTVVMGVCSALISPRLNARFGPQATLVPALLLALEALPQRPDLAFVDGHGIAHPRGLGIAAHFGVATDLPSIGVAKKILTGSGPEPHHTRGAYTALRRDGRQIGWLLRSKPKCKPLIVSPGHRVAMASAADLTMRFVAGYRLPEPTRLADRLASRRDRDRDLLG